MTFVKALWQPSWRDQRRKRLCRHPKTARLPGPRVPALYGSFATHVCADCGSWRRDIDVETGHNRWHHEAVSIEETERL